MKEAISTCDGCKFDANEALCAAPQRRFQRRFGGFAHFAAHEPKARTHTRELAGDDFINQKWDDF